MARVETQLQLAICTERRHPVDSVPPAVLIPVAHVKADFFEPCPEVSLPSRRESSLERCNGIPPDGWEEPLTFHWGKEYAYPAEIGGPRSSDELSIPENGASQHYISPWVKAHGVDDTPANTDRCGQLRSEEHIARPLSARFDQPESEWREAEATEVSRGFQTLPADVVVFRSVEGLVGRCLEVFQDTVWARQEAVQVDDLRVDVLVDDVASRKEREIVQRDASETSLQFADDISPVSRPVDRATAWNAEEVE